MSLAIAIQIDIDADSTLVIGLEAQRRGHRLFTYQPTHLTLRHDRLVARGWDLTLERVRGAHFQLGAPRTVDLADMDVVLLRQDPPFDLAYITTTHLLEHLPQRVLVLNDPAEVRNAPEKLLVTHFPQLMPPSLITCERAEIEDFRAEHRDIIIKPLFGCGGAGVFHLKPDDENLTSILEVFARLYPHEPVMVQRYLSAIRDGDKRIILVEGEPVGAVSRMPQSGEARANFHSGGQPRKTQLTDREREICAAIGPLLHRKGLVFTGIDVIGDWLTEINVTSPTGIQQINRLDGVQLEALVVDALEARLAARRALS